MSTRALRKRLDAMRALCLTAGLYADRWQYVVHLDSRIHPYVEGLPLPDANEALEHALQCAEKVSRRLFT